MDFGNSKDVDKECAGKYEAEAGKTTFGTKRRRVLANSIQKLRKRNCNFKVAASNLRSISLNKAQRT